ncbi:MAG: small ribosomal subunit Rsm22 family protein [Acidobacteriota bacterium]
MQTIEQLLLTRAFGPALAAQYQTGHLPERLLAPVARSLATLSLSFTDRAKFARGYLKDADLRRAYLLYYLPSNLPKIRFLLNELSIHPGGLPLGQELRLLDLGAGQGAATLGLLDYLNTARGLTYSQLRIVGVDLTSQSLEDYRWLVSQYLETIYPISHCLETYPVQLESGLPATVDGEYDLIIAANFLNELFRNNTAAIALRARWLAEEIGPRLASDGSIIIIEPALKDTTQALMQLHDLLINQYGFTIYSPCPTANNCPMLSVSVRDWCHSSVDWQRPSIITQLDKLIGNRKESLKFSYLILRRDGRSLIDTIASSSKTSCWRLVSDPHSEKGKTLIYACGGGAYLPMVRLKRAQSPANAQFAKVERGQLATLGEAMQRAQEVRIEQETLVELYGPYFETPPA